MPDRIHPLAAQPLTAEAFAPFGVVLEPEADGSPPNAAEAVLDLAAGTPRFYVMQLEDKPPRFTSVTRHRQVTQCLASVGGGEWLLAVAAPTGEADADARPTLADVAAFRVPGDVAVVLHKGTWHSGPYFEPAAMAFFNLELTDTNVVDHQSHRLVDEGHAQIELA